MVLRIGPRFEQQLLEGQPEPIQLILDARNSTTANSAAAAVAQVVAAYNLEQAQQRGGGAPALTLETRAWYNPNLESRWNFMPGMIAALSMIQTLLLTALSVAREREQGTFDQLLVTPLSPTEIMIGKAIPPMLIGLVQSTLVLLVTRFWFHIPMAGSAWSLYAGLAAFMLAGVGIGLSISAVSANMQQAMLYTFVLIMPMMLLSGLTTPVSNMPAALQIATMLNPLRFAIDLVRRVCTWKALACRRSGPISSPLLLIAAVTPCPRRRLQLFRNRLV